MGHDGQTAIRFHSGIAPRLIESIVDIQVLDALDLDVNARQADTVRRIARLAVRRTSKPFDRQSLANSNSPALPLALLLVMLSPSSGWLL